jgi:hypothetical protein
VTTWVAYVELIGGQIVPRTIEADNLDGARAAAASLRDVARVLEVARDERQDC